MFFSSMFPVPVSYFLLLMIITTLTVAESVGIVQLMRSDPETPPPTWLRSLTYGCLVNFTCMKIPKGLPGSTSKIGAEGETNAGSRLPDDGITSVTHFDTREDPSPRSYDGESENPTARSDEENGSEEMIQKEYQFIAAVVDKFFAGFFLLLLVVGSLILLFAYPHVRNTQDFPPADNSM